MRVIRRFFAENLVAALQTIGIAKILTLQEIEATFYFGVLTFFRHSLTPWLWGRLPPVKIYFI
jgi:hypothetical protein